MRKKKRMKSSERIVPYCFIDMKRDCPTYCRLFSESVKSIVVGAEDESMTTSQFTRFIRLRYLMFTDQEQAAIINERARGIGRRVGDSGKLCVNYKAQI